ncbi:MAG: MetQ/NlpA family ABC transporter substrate-binding protein [Desulfovibrio sp.]|jgi:D-methionine transport system substrate-binding protein|nr:MetQ/NlpA family ABC transporter substrate-binding protein [Desulfovibrio sp.]
MKRLFRTLLIVSLLLPAFPAGSAAADGGARLIVGVTPFPHKDIMLIAGELLAKEGITLEIREFSDYVQPNLALADKALDANFFQHIPYLENMVREKGLKLTWTAKVHIEPLGLYSKAIRNTAELRGGDSVAVPNDPTNEARALRLLEKHGLIKVRAGELVTVRDITDNVKGLRFVELEAAQLPRLLQDVRAAVINTNFAAEAGLIPSRDALIIEDKDSPYANVTVVRSEDTDKTEIKALTKAVNSPEVKAYIERELVPRGIVPAF